MHHLLSLFLRASMLAAISLAFSLNAYSATLTSSTLTIAETAHDSSSATITFTITNIFTGLIPTNTYTEFNNLNFTPSGNISSYHTNNQPIPSTDPSTSTSAISISVGSNGTYTFSNILNFLVLVTDPPNYSTQDFQARYLDASITISDIGSPSTSVPEPSTINLLAASFFAYGLMMLRRSKGRGA